MIKARSLLTSSLLSHSSTHQLQYFCHIELYLSLTLLCSRLLYINTVSLATFHSGSRPQAPNPLLPLPHATILSKHFVSTHRRLVASKSKDGHSKNPASSAHPYRVINLSHRSDHSSTALHLRASVPTTMFSCVNYERGCRGRTNQNQGRCGDCIALNIASSSRASSNASSASGYSPMSGAFASLASLQGSGQQGGA
ncbi:hypothetical protein EJ06DRAFT_268208 [Trichodelitschia bisporula]|uniref:Uncharacterized protein n=1 Tax=Trichodelitschia bisporula TaxID=703511 RepID=A0A6G1HHM4_9PEZI|nr:hypothetical protein EJ06DRAFT_268208 [Trichodelitschia bisporula]